MMHDAVNEICGCLSPPYTSILDDLKSLLEAHRLWAGSVQKNMQNDIVTIFVVI